MRPYLVLAAAVLAVVALTTVAGFGQQPVPRPYGNCFYGCGPFIPLLTTPEISLEQFSPNPVGATNATTGLIAGATNSTLSQEVGSTSSVYTVAVWYQGGSPLITPSVRLWPQTIGREGQVIHEAIHEPMTAQRPGEEGAFGLRPHEGRPHERRSDEERAPRAEAPAYWTYFTGPVANPAAPEASGIKKAGRVYGNSDVTRQNDKNGTVKYDGKTEKM